MPLSSKPLRIGLLAIFAAVTATSANAAPLSNEAFAAQVRVLRAEISSDNQALERAAILCTNLPKHRSADEPQCVALQLYLKSTVPVASKPSSLLSCTKSAISSALNELAVLVVGAA